jgi:hypothetical protein
MTAEHIQGLSSKSIQTFHLRIDQNQEKEKGSQRKEISNSLNRKFKLIKTSP